jgi:hypothetical protein
MFRSESPAPALFHILGERLHRFFGESESPRIPADWWAQLPYIARKRARQDSNLRPPA